MRACGKPVRSASFYGWPTENVKDWELSTPIVPGLAILSPIIEGKSPPWYGEKIRKSMFRFSNELERFTVDWTTNSRSVLENCPGLARSVFFRKKLWDGECQTLPCCCQKSPNLRQNGQRKGAKKPPKDGCLGLSPWCGGTVLGRGWDTGNV